MNRPPFHPARKNALGGWAVHRLLIQPALQRAFGGIYASIRPSTLALRRPSSMPTIFCVTHVGWWDGYMAAILDLRVFRQDAYLMMEETNLRRYWFFTWAGAFGIDRDNPRYAVASIEYIRDVLSRGSNRALWMFPQGRMQHADARPLALYGGAINIARRLGKCALVPVALRYDFLMEQAPVALARLGPPIIVSEPVDSRELKDHLAVAMTQAAERLHLDVAAYDLRDYRLIMTGRGSANRAWDNVLRIAQLSRRLLRIR